MPRSSPIRYAQCWEDAQLLLDGLQIRPSDRCLSIASAGDNTLALLLADPAEVIAVDMSGEQLACLALRAAAYRELSYNELLGLMGFQPHEHRIGLYERCRPHLDDAAQDFWDRHPELIREGVGRAGRFEHYLRIFRKVVLPLTQSHRTVRSIMLAADREERVSIYENAWDNWRWRAVCQVFASRLVMGTVGREASFFDQVEGPIAKRIIERFRRTLVDIPPSVNPYMQWILTGRYLSTYPPAFQPENVPIICERLNRVSWHRATLEEVLADQEAASFDAYNLSDVFEYMDEPVYHAHLSAIVRASKPGARMAYWNLFVERHRPERMADRIRPLGDLSAALSMQDRAFFYERFVLEEVL